MNTLEAVRIALQSLWANKLRSVLTLLGVVIGVAAVIAVVTFVNGINGYVAEKVFSLGADVFILARPPNVITNTDQYLEGQRRKEITMDDYGRLPTAAGLQVRGRHRPRRQMASVKLQRTEQQRHLGARLDRLDGADL